MICLSAISVSVRRLIASDDTTIDITGSESGSTLVMTGGSSCGGTFFIAPATFSRTSLAASLMSRSSTNRTVIVALPSLMRADISSMPETPLSVSSIGSTTDVAISSGLAPGSDSETLTVAGIGLGKQVDAEIAEREDAEHDERHHEHRREDRPADAEFRQHALAPSPSP